MQGIVALLIFWKILVVLGAQCREAIVESCYSQSTALCALMESICVLDHHVWVQGKFHGMGLLSLWYLQATPFLDFQPLKPRYNKIFLYSFQPHILLFIFTGKGCIIHPQADHFQSCRKLKKKFP